MMFELSQDQDQESHGSKRVRRSTSIVGYMLVEKSDVDVESYGTERLCDIP